MEEYDEEEIWEKAVEGEIGSEHAELLRENYRKERNGYKWGKEYNISTSSDIDQAEGFSIGWDIKITPEDEVKIIEINVDEFFPIKRTVGTRGFKKAFQYGDISGDRIKSHHDVTNGYRFLDFARLHSSKEVLHMSLDEGLGEYLPTKVEDENVDDIISEKVVLKPADRGGGRGVNVMGTEDYKEWLEEEESFFDRFSLSDKLAEEFVPSKTIHYKGRPYEGCMRYITNLEVEGSELTVTDLGGYWRTASEPQDSDASLVDRYVANLSQGGHAVPASFEELSKASETVLEVTEEMYEMYASGRQNLREEEGLSSYHPGINFFLSGPVNLGSLFVLASPAPWLFAIMAPLGIGLNLSTPAMQKSRATSILDKSEYKLD